MDLFASRKKSRNPKIKKVTRVLSQVLSRSGREFCTIISAHQKCGNKLSIDWCSISQFSDKEAITTTSWQSYQYLAFARMSLVYFGLLEEYGDEIDGAQINAFQQVFVLWFMLLSALFNENKPNTRLVDDCVRLFLSACIYYGGNNYKSCL